MSDNPQDCADKLREYTQKEERDKYVNAFTARDNGIPIVINRLDECLYNILFGNNKGE